MGNKYSSLTEEQLASVFKKHDRDRDEKLTKEELKSAFESLGSRWSTFRADESLRAVDINGDSIISLGGISKLIGYVKGCQGK